MNIILNDAVKGMRGGEVHQDFLKQRTVLFFAELKTASFLFECSTPFTWPLQT